MSKLLKLPKYVYAAIVLLVVVIVVALILNSRANNTDAKWKKAQDYFKVQKYQEANAEMKGLDIPSNQDRLKVYAQTKLAVKDLPDALKGYQKLYKENPDQSYELAVGNIYNEQKNYDESIKAYRSVITQNPLNQQAYVNLSTVYKLQGNVAQAQAVAVESVKNNPQNKVLRELLVSTYLDDQGSQAFQDAVAGLRNLDPNDELLQQLKNGSAVGTPGATTTKSTSTTSTSTTSTTAKKTK